MIKDRVGNNVESVEVVGFRLGKFMILGLVMVRARIYILSIQLVLEKF